jgi:CheY-like chemotaxis protein
MLRVLVLGGAPDASQALAALLASWGHNVLAADDPAQAVNLAAERRPDVALLDVCSPGGGGYELAAWLRTLPGDSPVWLVALTDMREGWRPSRAHRAGFHLFLPSPVRHEDLRRLLDNFAALGAARPPLTRAPGRVAPQGEELPRGLYAGLPPALTLSWLGPGSAEPPDAP